MTAIARRAIAEIFYNGKNIKTTLDEYAVAFSYSDPDHGEADSIDITIADPLGEWIGSWLPSKGDEISAIISWNNLLEQPGVVACGRFVIDDLSFSSGNSGSTFKICAVSTPADDAFHATERTKTWKKVTLRKIAETILSRYEMNLAFYAQDVSLSVIEQSKQADCPFLTEVAEKYGLFLKVYDKKLVIFDRDVFKKKDVVTTISKEDISSFSWNTQLAGTYTGGEITYSKPKTNKTLKYSVGTGKRILRLNEQVESQAEAKRRIEAEIKKANHATTTIDISMIGRPDLVAGQNFLLTGFQKLSGKYYIDRITHDIGGNGYTSKIEASFVEEEKKN